MLCETGVLQQVCCQHCGHWWPGTRPAVATVLTMHPCISSYLRVNVNECHCMNIHYVFYSHSDNHSLTIVSNTIPPGSGWVSEFREDVNLCNWFMKSFYFSIWFSTTKAMTLTDDNRDCNCMHITLMCVDRLCCEWRNYVTRYITVICKEECSIIHYVCFKYDK